MPDISSVTSFFPRAFENTVPMTLGGSILAGATTVPVSGMTNYNDNDVVCFVVSPATPALKQVFTGTKSGSNVINVVWTEMPSGGVNVDHAAGVTVVDYVTATDWDMAMHGVTQSLNQDGSLIPAAVRTALNITGGAAGGWTPTGYAPSAVVYNGNRSYTCTFSAADLTPTLTAGMRLQFIRTFTAPTKSTSLNGTTQYYSKSSPNKLTFTDDFVVSAWIKLSSYNGAVNVIASRYNGTSGWALFINASGQVSLTGVNGGSGNHSDVLSYQSVPLNKWVHVAAQLDMSAFTATTTTSYIMIDGVDVPASVVRAGTNPTALIQAGSLEVGSQNSGTLPFAGKIAQAAVFNAKVTQATMVTYISQGLAGTETSLASAYSFNNSISDLNTTTPNDLTANNSAVATNADTPFTQTTTGVTVGTTNYGIIQSVSFSTNTTVVVQVPEGGTLPTSGGVSAVSYSTNRMPYGFPGQVRKWIIECAIKVQTTQASPTSSTWYNMGPSYLTIPIGEWIAGYSIVQQHNAGVAGTISVETTLSTANNTDSDNRFNAHLEINSLLIDGPAVRSADISVAAAAPYYLNCRAIAQSGSSQIYHRGELSVTRITAENAYL